MPKSTIWDESDYSTSGPQITHNLSKPLSLNFVDKLCIKYLLLRHNSHALPFWGLFSPCFFPTMKFQPSQLPMIVGSGRVVIRRALFSCLLPFQFNHL